VAAAGLGFVTGGPVAAVILAAYAGLAGRAVLRRAARMRAKAARAAALDGLAALAADLRAGLPRVAAGLESPRVAAGLESPAVAAGLEALPVAAGLELPAVAAGLEVPADRLGRLTSSVWRLADRTGAAAADLVERIEADARASDRAAASAGAQAAGAQATGLLLAALPLGGLGLGLAVGADPIGVLLHTAVGAACALAGVALQVAGLLWTERLLAGVVR
jgi:tight adherence protein B